MATIPRSQSADPSALGYYHQGLYALVVLAEAGDDAYVSVETDDDVVLTDKITTLTQLKHSTGNPAPLTISDVGLWKAILNWSKRPHDGAEEFVFATCAEIGVMSELRVLSEPGSKREKLLQQLREEAGRVLKERAEAKANAKNKDKPLPHVARADGCEAFHKLAAARQQGLVNHIQITPSSFNADETPAELAQILGGGLLPKVRSQIIERLIEWWDRQIVLSLLGKRSRDIPKIELQTQLSKLVADHQPDHLPDDFSLKEPDGSDDGGRGRVMEKQIEWVKGGNARVNRAALARWRARNQRERWVDDNIAMAAKLTDYDLRLQRAWKDLFEPMKEDCDGKGDQKCITEGLKLLNWSHEKSHNDIPPILESWPHPFLVQGSLQQLAEEGLVGWHPDYDDRVKKLNDEEK